MAGDWLKIDTRLDQKEEVYDMADELSLSNHDVVGRLVAAWSWFDSNTVDGITRAKNKRIIDRICETKNFCDAMIKAGWMAEDNENITLPNFDRHNGASAKTRALTARRQAKSRSNKTSNADVTDESRNSNAATVTHASLEKRSIEKRREEKYREEIKDTPLTPQGDVATKKPKPKAGAINLDNLPIAISQESAQGFIDHRKLMKAPLTQRAFDLAIKSALNANEIGLTPDQAIDQTVANGWKGINLDWLANKATTGGSRAPQEHDVDATVKLIMENRAKKALEENTIDGECRVVHE